MTDEVAAEWVNVEDLTPWAANPRENESAVAEVVKSIERFGFGAPLLARKENGEIIAGHTRIRAALDMGLDRVPVRYLDLSESEAHALALADNKLAEIAEWSDGLADVLAELDVDAAGLGWTEDDLKTLLGQVVPPEEGPTPPPDEEGPVDSVEGAVYELGPHRLICGSCRDPETVARLLDGTEINVAFTSPPYASQRKYDESSGFKPIAPDDFSGWFEPVQSAVREHLAEGGSWFVNIKEHCEDGQRSLYVKDLTLAHVRRWGWRFVDEFSWNRNAAPGRWPDRFKNGWEPVFHFARGALSSFNPEAVGHASNHIPKNTSEVGLGANKNATNGEYWNVASEKEAGIALPSNVLKVSGVENGTGHTAAFPVALPTFFIRAFSDEGAAIFDPFLGSGTTLIAAAECSRVGYGCEISPKYCDVIRRRWGAFAEKNGLEPGSGAL